MDNKNDQSTKVKPQNRDISYQSILCEVIHSLLTQPVIGVIGHVTGVQMVHGDTSRPRICDM